LYQPQTIYTKVALEAILHLFNEKNTESDIHELPEELSEMRRGCFVSLHKTDGSLRGCIGTIEPIEENLYQEITRNAISAALRDTRFSPLTVEEMEDVEISVDVLTVPEEIFDLDDLDPHIYGLIVKGNSNKRAVLLPSIPDIDTVDKQIDIVKRKAGLDHVKNKKLRFYRFTSNRYH
jgi:hypothetical protein